MCNMFSLFCIVGNNSATIIGIACGIVGGIVLVSLVIFIVYCYVKRRHDKSQSADFVTRRESQGKGYEPLQMELAKKNKPKRKKSQRCKFSFAHISMAG